MIVIYSRVEKLLNIMLLVDQHLNICLLDLSKVFDKINHFALYLKPMDRSVLVQLLLVSVLENWLSWCMSCVTWAPTLSLFYELKADVRRGGVFLYFRNASKSACMRYGPSIKYL